VQSTNETSSFFFLGIVNAAAPSADVYDNEERLKMSF
jgi:hypothetical protein